MAPSPIYDNADTPGHHTIKDNFSIVGRESHTITRIIKQAMLMRVNDPSVKRNIGNYQLSHIWDIYIYIYIYIYLYII